MRVQFFRRSREIEPRFRLVNLLGISNAVCRLRHRRQCFCRQSFGNGCAAQLRQLVMQALRRVIIGNGQRFFQQHIASVQSRLHLHDGHTGLTVTGHNGALYRGGAAPARQKRSVNVPASQRRHIEPVLRQNHAIGGDNGELGRQRAKARQFVFIFQVGRGEDVNACLFCRRMHG